MTSDSAQIAYLLLAALFMAVTTHRAMRPRTAGWQVSAALVWVAIFVILAVAAERMGWRPA